MEFRYPVAAAEKNAASLNYLTKDLEDPKAGRTTFEKLLRDLGNSIETYPDWHPVLTAPLHNTDDWRASISELEAYKGIDHTVLFVKGFVTCPYSENKANKLVETVNLISGLHAYRLQAALYSDNAYPVAIMAHDIELEADGTIRGRDALAWCTQQFVKGARDAQVAETWWNMRSCILGHPHGSRSSLLVNQHTGGHMRKILEALNNSGMFGPIKEWSLEMLSEKKRKNISENLIRTALNSREESKSRDKFEFELRGEVCKAEIRDTWDDGHELSIRVTIGNFDLYTSGFYYAKNDLLQIGDINGKRILAEKFI